ncbi:MAG: alpha/beta fold hydrolase [Acidimicrobiales bacterium]
MAWPDGLSLTRRRTHQPRWWQDRHALFARLRWHTSNRTAARRPLGHSRVYGPRPRLPGHGTSADDMATTGWDDWAAEVERALDSLLESTEKAVIVGLSMGGTLALSTAISRDDVAGVVAINPLVSVDPDMVEQVQLFVDSGATEIDNGPADVSDPEVVELGYQTLPLKPMLSLYENAERTLSGLPDLTVPVLVITSRNDHQVPTQNSALVVEALGTRASQVWLEKRFHVATLDVENDRIAVAINQFVGTL